MTSGPDGSPLSPDEHDWLSAVRAADGLADLLALTDADSEHGAYFAAKDRWADLRARQLAESGSGSGSASGSASADAIPGIRVDVDGHAFHVHGITHAGTDEERAFLRGGVDRLLARDATVYCEQGIRRLYFDDRPAVCEMDDYRWAMAECRKLDVDSHAADLVEPEAEFEGLVEELDALTARFREAAFSLVDSGRDVYGDAFALALGDVASSFLTSHADAATGEDFEAFARTREAATNPDALAGLQNYYERRFLPQPLEREWLRRHDRELEIVTHARNERMADYAVYHNDDADEVHLIVGAAHGPGIRYYLEAHRDGRRDPSGFDPVA